MSLSKLKYNDQETNIIKDTIDFSKNLDFFVSMIKNIDLDYNRESPFHPSKKYPEYPFNETGGKNDVYEAVRELFCMLSLDIENFGKASWNPLGVIIKPGDTVLIKPNFVRHFNIVGGIEEMITHGSIIRAVMDYAYIALKGTGKIIVGDSPLGNGDFNRIAEMSGLYGVSDHYKNNGIDIEIIDFRVYKMIPKGPEALSDKIKNGDPLGYSAIDLKDDSELLEIINDNKKFRNTNYDSSEMAQHHLRGKNEFLIPNSILSADVILNLPKLKTHRKAGLTCALKNQIGINGCKAWLPHHRIGSIEEGGDEYLHKSLRKSIQSRINDKMPDRNRGYMLVRTIFDIFVAVSRRIKPFKDTYFEGSWYGNETLPRTITDLNKIIFYADKNGIMRDELQRKMLILVDGILAGEGNGPIEPLAKKCGILMAGFNPVSIDYVCPFIMGFDHKKIPIFKYVFKPKKYKIFNGKVEDIKVILNGKIMDEKDLYKVLNHHFIPNPGWIGHIEYDGSLES